MGIFAEDMIIFCANILMARVLRKYKRPRYRLLYGRRCRLTDYVFIPSRPFHILAGE